MKKREVSLALNMLLIIFECIGFILSIAEYNTIHFEYYTEDSNFIALIASLTFIIFMGINKKVPRLVSIFKYISNICLTLTCFVVIFILLPMYDYDFAMLLFDGPILYHHLLCPIISLISFFFYDDLGKLTKSDSIKGMSFTILYGLVLIPLNIFMIVEGPYPFLMVKDQSIVVSIFWMILLLSLVGLISYVLRKLYLKHNYRG